MLRFKSITTKFILIGLIMIFFTAAYLFRDYRFTQHIRGEATRINIAGQMRFRNFEMAWLIHKIAEAKRPELRESLIMELKHEMDTFEDIAKDLKEGNRSLSQEGRVQGHRGGRSCPLKSSLPFRRRL